jgi:hypothetical protein
MLRPKINPNAPPDSVEAWNEALARDKWDAANHWGTEFNHPGTLGKIGHVLGQIGQIAGTAVAPGVVAAIPGTTLNRNLREAGETAQLHQAEGEERAGEQEKRAESQEQRAEEAAKYDTPEKRQDYMQKNPDLFKDLPDFERNDYVLSGKFPQREPPAPKEANLQQGYSAAVQDAIKNGRDPASDPTVKQWADAITSIQPEKQNKPTGAEDDAKYEGILQNRALGKPISAEDNAFVKAYEARKTLGPRTTFNLQAQGVGAGTPVPTTNANGEPATYEDQIKSLGPKGGVVSAIIEGRQEPPKSFAQKSPYWQDIMQKVYAIDPQFNEQRAQLRKEYTTGKRAGEINAINTAMGHVGILGDAITSLQNGDIVALNAIANTYGLQVGKDPITTFKTIVHRVGPEIAKAYIGAGGSAGERGSDEKDFSPDLAPNQLKGNVSITAKLLRSKIAAMENQWNQNKAPSMRAFQDQFIMPEAKAELDKWSPSAGAKPPGWK